MSNTSSSVNNKQIAKNTLFLYLRMLMVMGVGLYTVRAILHLLGVVDYGIYNVVGGVVGMFAFLNSTLATSSQRYFSIELAKGDLDRLNKWFCLNISTFSIFIIYHILTIKILLSCRLVTLHHLKVYYTLCEFKSIVQKNSFIKIKRNLIFLLVFLCFH